MRPSVISQELSPSDRFREIARLLAVGVLRLHARSALAAGKAQKTTEKGLAVFAQQSVTVHTS